MGVVAVGVVVVGVRLFVDATFAWCTGIGSTLNTMIFTRRSSWGVFDILGS